MEQALLPWPLPLVKEDVVGEGPIEIPHDLHVNSIIGGGQQLRILPRVLLHLLTTACRAVDTTTAASTICWTVYCKVKESHHGGYRLLIVPAAQLAGTMFIPLLCLYLNTFLWQGADVQTQ